MPRGEALLPLGGLLVHCVDFSKRVMLMSSGVADLLLYQVSSPSLVIVDSSTEAFVLRFGSKGNES